MSKISKLLVLLVTATLFSCSGDEDTASNIPPPANSLKKVTETTYIGGSVENYSANFNYENGILKSISDPNNRIEITYTNNKISSTIYYKNEVLQNSYAFNYNGGLLETILNTKNNFERTLYEYNNGILASEKNQSLIGGTWQTGDTQNYVFTNGNISQEIRIFQNNAPYKNTHDYDTKLNPMHYMNPEVRTLLGMESIELKSVNNKTNTYKYSSASSTTPILDFTHQILYNAQNLPISVKKYTTSNTLVSEATFEYN